ncbi:MAG: hypothetical protein M8354_07375 [Halalkalicoccus sp.]|nr:hypothetical protein [Halalkalicoccus sp.]
MDQSLAEIETELAETTEIEDDERARDRLEAVREELSALRKRGDVDEERADALETEISQHLRAIEERDSYDVDTMGAARDPDDETV